MLRHVDATGASTRWYAENVAASATMRYRGTEMFTRSPRQSLAGQQIGR